MQFNRRNINKRLRNGDIISSSLYSSNSSGGSSSGGILSGNYLPATQNADGTYTVDLTQVNFNGNVIASGEVSAYGSGSTSGNTSVGTIDIEDHLNSTRTDAALSANQGRLLKELIDNVEVDLSDYYNKSQIDNKLSNLNVDLSNYYNKIQIDEKLENLDDYYKKQEVDNKLNNKLDKSTWNDVFSIDSNGNLKIKVDVIGEGEISAYGSGTTASTEINLGNYYTKDEVDDLLDNIDIPTQEIDLTNYYTKSQTDSKLSNKSDTSHTHSLSELTSTAHTHNYTSVVKLGDKEYNVSNNVISLPSYPSYTLSGLGGVDSTTFNAHTSNTTSHITSKERENWSAAYNNNHSHSNITVLDGITSAKVNNWNDVYSDWNEVFSINSDGSLKVKVNLYGEGEISAFGSGTTENEINLENYYTKNEVDDLLDNIDIPTQEIDLTNYYTKSQMDSKLSNKSDTRHTHTEYSPSSHTHSLSELTSTAHTHSTATTSASGLMSASDKSKLDGITASADSVSFTRSLTAGTKVGTITINGTGTDIYCETNTNTTYSNATSGTSGLMSAADKTKLDGITASADSVSFTRSLTAGTKVGTITINGTATDLYCEKNTDTNTTYSVVGANGSTGLVKNGSSVTNASGYIACPIVGGVPYYKDTNTTYTLSGLGGVANSTFTAHTASTVHITSTERTNWNKAYNSIHSHSTLTFTGGKFSAKSYNPSAAVTVNVPTHTSHITNDSGYITTAATVANANYATSAGSATNATNATNADKLDGYHGSSANTASNYVLRGSSGQINVGAISAAGNVTATGEVTAHSDKRLKDNIQPLTNRGYVIPTTYIKDGKQSIGFIAQDMQKLYPELVIVDESTEEKYLSVNYMQYTAVLQAQIIELQEKLNSLWKIIKEKDIY